MRIESLRLIHLKKGTNLSPEAIEAAAQLTAALPGVFLLDSCQRWVWVGSSSDFAGLDIPEVSGLRFFSGVDAYVMLLRIATGLESEIVGETDIFGQLKEAWKRMGDSRDSELNFWVQKLFEDTKDIRSRFLQNMGGASYGSLVRMLLRDRKGPTLIVGAGQLGQSVAPYLTESELWISNRSPENLAVLYADLQTRETQGVRVISQDDEAQAWREAEQVVICVPFDPNGKDAERVRLRAQKADGVVVHLGGMRAQAGSWTEVPNLFTLDDLFALQKTQGDVRMTQVAQAARACQEKGKLRSLGASVTIPHGWEDLAVFA